MFADLGSAPATMEASRAGDFIGCAPGSATEIADADQAYIQDLPSVNAMCAVCPQCLGVNIQNIQSSLEHIFRIYTMYMVYIQDKPSVEGIYLGYPQRMGYESKICPAYRVHIQDELPNV